LLLDFLALKNYEESVHYLGTIVLQTEDNKTYTIIDGQKDTNIEPNNTWMFKMVDRFN